VKTVDPECFFNVDTIIDEVKEKLSRTPDTITLAGSGEPTLHSKIDMVIESIKAITSTRVAVLTNGSCFWKDDIRKRVLGADIILPTLCTAKEQTFRIIHRPHPEIKNEAVIEGLRKLREDFTGQIFVEIVLLSGINDTEEELEKLKVAMELISPDRIQLNTVVRPPSDSRAVPVNKSKLEKTRARFGKKAEIVVERGKNISGGQKDGLSEEIIGMVKRRPLRPVDISDALGLSLDRVEDLVKGLSIKGLLVKRKYDGDIYYLSNQEEN
jgi:wyosine [tRNA(Phe)-imidazoG37] synthetase (radical SAM superfamily)